MLFSGSHVPDLFQEMVSASWCGVLASLSLLLEARCVLRIIVSHTLNAFCLPHDNVILLATLMTMQQHLIDTSISITMITELESTTAEKLHVPKC